MIFYHTIFFSFLLVFILPNHFFTSFSSHILMICILDYYLHSSNFHTYLLVHFVILLFKCILVIFSYFIISISYISSHVISFSHSIILSYNVSSMLFYFFSVYVLQFLHLQIYSSTHTFPHRNLRYILFLFLFYFQYNSSHIISISHSVTESNNILR